MGVQPGRLATRYAPGGERAEVRQLTPDGKPRPPFGVGLTGRGEFNETSEGGRS